MIKPHKWDQGAYVVTCFDSRNRKKGTRTRPSIHTAQQFGRRWLRMFGGHYAIHVVVENSAQRKVPPYQRKFKWSK